ncbi:hypothetical protein [Paenibacillus sp. Marseille-Q7038]
MNKQKRSVGLLSVLFVLILVISACSETKEISSGVSEAMKVAKKYKIAELESPQISEVTDEIITEKQEVMKPLTTENFFSKSVASRVFTRGSQVAAIKDSAVSLSNLEFTERNVNETQIELNYTGTASLGEEALDLEGTIYLLKEADEWKVNNDVYNTEIIMNIFDENMLKNNLERP